MNEKINLVKFTEGLIDLSEKPTDSSSGGTVQELGLKLTDSLEELSEVIENQK